MGLDCAIQFGSDFDASAGADNDADANLDWNLDINTLMAGSMSTPKYVVKLRVGCELILKMDT